MTYALCARRALLVALLCAAAIVGAQAPPIALGTRVRVEMHDKSRIEGTLMAQSAESLAVASPRAVRTRISTDYIARVRRGECKSHGHGAEKWTTLYTTPQRVSLVPAPGTAPGIGIRVGF